MRILFSDTDLDNNSQRKVGNIGDQPFAIGSHRSCSLTSKSYASRACVSSPLSIVSEFSEGASPASAPSLRGDTDIMYRLAAEQF